MLLDFWATWCAPCRAEIPRLIALQKHYRRRPFQIIGVSLDDGPAAPRSFRRESGMNYPVVIGNAALAGRYGGILGLPVAFLIDCHGRIHARFDGTITNETIEKQLDPLLRDCGTK